MLRTSQAAAAAVEQPSATGAAGAPPPLATGRWRQIRGKRKCWVGSKGTTVIVEMEVDITQAACCLPLDGGSRVMAGHPGPAACLRASLPAFC